MLEQSTNTVWDLEKEFNKEIKNVRIFQGNPSRLYHYTTLEGLQGIINSKIMRLTRIDAVNDATEIQYFHDLLNEIMDEHLSNKEPFFIDLKNEINCKNDEIYFPTPPGNRKKDDSFLLYKEIFVCSFSNNEDSLDMWKYYSKGDGVCIGIDTTGKYGIEEEIDRQYLRPEMPIKSVVIDKFYGGVVYEKDEQVKIIEKVIGIGKQSYAKFLEGSDDEIIRRCWVNWFYRKILFPISIFMKHEAFFSECESRVAIVKRYTMGDEREWNTLAFQGKYANQYEFSGGRIRPYVNNEIFDKESLTQVTLSPISKLDEKLLFEYLQSQKVKIDKEHVRKSTLPLRF